MRDYLPETIDSHGYVKIRPTLQVDASDVSPKKFSEKLDRIYTIGDVSFRSCESLHLLTFIPCEFEHSLISRRISRLQQLA